MAERADPRGDLGDLRDVLQRMEQRLARVERSLGIFDGGRAPETDATGRGEDAAFGRQAADDVALEYRIGEFWVGRMGVVALWISIAFFISYPFGPAFPPAFQNLAGYLAAGAFFALSRSWRLSYPSTSRILFAGSLILLYFSTLRLHFFTESPVVPQKAIVLALLTLVLGFLLYVAILRRSQHLACLALFLGFATSLCSDTIHFALVLTAVTSAAAVWMQLRYNWRHGAIFSVFMAYAVHLIWMLNNPILGRPMQAIADHHNSLVYLFIYAALFGTAGLYRAQTSDWTAANVALSFLNGVGFYALSSLVALTYFRERSAEVQIAVSVFLVALAAVYWTVRQSRFSTAFYACLGYVALSAAIVSYFGGPARFVWLGWQSLLVISSAIWFRSRMVVVANVLIYLGILCFYLFAQPPHLWTNLSYAAVALLSARVMNWQKQRLALRTELMRNAYLGSAFVVVPYGLYHGVPQGYVSLSWLGATLFYFAMSLILGNRKYRWMAILTMFLTVIHVFAFDLLRISPIYRMILFLVLGLTMLVVSWAYARYRKRERPEC